MEFDLEWLLYPVLPDSFSGEYWGNLPLRIDRSSNYYSDLLSESEIEFAIYRASMDSNALELLSEHETPEMCKSHSHAIEGFRKGKSLRIDSIQRYSSQITILSRNLERVTNCPTNVNLYLSPGSGKKALDRHYDTHDVFVLQISGNKTWRIYDKPFLSPLEFLPLQRHESIKMMKRFRLGYDLSAKNSCDLAEEFTLKAGDCLYLPRGVWHEAESKPDEVSCHLTVGIQPFTYLDVISLAIAKSAFSDRSLRESLPFGFATDPSSASTVAKKISKIVDELPSNLEPEIALKELTGHFLRMRRTSFENDLLRRPESTSALTLAEDSLIRVRKGMICTVLAGAPLVLMAFGGKEFRITASYEEACRFIAIATNFRVGDLPGNLSFPEQAVLVQQLISEGLLVQHETGTSPSEQSSSYEAIWFPTNLYLREKTIEWVDVGKWPLSAPFLHQTVDRLKVEHKNPITRTTGFDALKKIGDGLDPTGFIFHISRCGSTLLCNGLKMLPGAVVISEPKPVSALLEQLSTSAVTEGGSTEFPLDVQDLLRGFFRAYGQRRTGNESALVIKFTSWNILHIASIRSLWPKVPCVIIIREPSEVAVSWLDQPGKWLNKEKLQVTSRISTHDGVEDSGTITDESFYARRIGEYLRCAGNAADEHCQIIDYKDLKKDLIVKVATLFGIEVTPEGAEGIENSLLVYSKDMKGKRPFVRDQEAKKAKVTEVLRQEIDKWALDEYDRLAFIQREQKSMQLST